MRPDRRPLTLETLGLSLWAVGAVATEGLVFAGFAVAALGWGLKHRGAGFRAHRTGLFAAALLVVLCFVSQLWCVGQPRMGTPWSILHLLMFPVALLAWRDLDDPARRTVARTLAGSSAVAAVVAIQQHFVLLPYPAWAEKLAPVHRVSAPAPGGYEAGGLHFHRLKHAHTLLPLLFGLVVQPWTHRGLAIAGAVLILVSVAFTFAKAAFGAFAVAVVVALVARKLPPKARIVLAAAILAASPVIPVLLEAIHKGPADRLAAWDLALRLISQHPLAGVGYGGYGRSALALMGGEANPEFIYIHVDAHNTWLMILAENGVIGLAALLFGLVCYARLLGPLSAAQLGIVAFAAVAGMTHNLPYHPVVTGALALALALASPPAPSA